MSALTSDSLARDWARRLESKEAERAGLPLRAARKRLADRLGVLPGTLENLSRDRIKGVRHWIFLALHEAMKGEIRREIAAHQHELAKLEAIGGHPDQREVRSVLEGLETDLSKLEAGA